VSENKEGYEGGGDADSGKGANPAPLVHAGGGQTTHVLNPMGGVRATSAASAPAASAAATVSESSICKGRAAERGG